MYCESAYHLKDDPTKAKTVSCMLMHPRASKRDAGSQSPMSSNETRTLYAYIVEGRDGLGRPAEAGLKLEQSGTVVCASRLRTASRQASEVVERDPDPVRIGGS